MYFGGIVVRIDEALDEAYTRELEREFEREEGVYDACIHANRHHLLLVDYDPDRVQPDHIMQSVARPRASRGDDPSLTGKGSRFLEVSAREGRSLPVFIPFSPFTV